MNLFELLTFEPQNPESLALACEKSLTELAPDLIHSNRSKYKYLQGYLADISVKSILVEKEYLDLGFLEDYSNYYSRSFKGCKQKCCRLHFFKQDLTEESIVTQMLKQGSLMDDIDHSELPRLNSRELGYAGYIVLKPLSQAYFGRTCLETYPERKGERDCNKEKRHYSVTKNYPVHLLGMRFAVCSLGFQEQDHIVSRCATNALWSCLQATGSLFQHHIPSLFEITTPEGMTFDSETRSVPSLGLTKRHMAHVFNSYGLEPEMIKPRTYRQLLSFCYAYLKCGIPLIAEFLIDKVKESAIDESRLETIRPTMDSSNEFDSRKHAICVAGFSVEDDAFAVDNSSDHLEPDTKLSNFRTKGFALKRIYAHDDQRGPFARYLPFDYTRNKDKLGEDASKQRSNFEKLGLVRDSAEDNVLTGTSMMTPTALLVPLHPLIRISYQHIMNTVHCFNQIWYVVTNNSQAWDIYLTGAVRYKEEMLYDNSVSDYAKLSLCDRNLPKFIWVASLLVEKRYVVDFIFDSTDSHLSDYLFHVLIRDESWFRDYSNGARLVASAGMKFEPQIQSMLRNSTSPEWLPSDHPG